VMPDFPDNSQSSWSDLLFGWKRPKGSGSCGNLLQKIRN
jgi:hypothetical protein